MPFIWESIASWSSEMSWTNNSLKSQIVHGLSAGLVVGLINVIFAISLSALVFAGDNSPYIANGIGFILLGGIPPLLLLSLFSSYKGSMGILQNMLSSPLQDKYITVVVAIILTTVLTGLVYILLGNLD